MKQSNFSLADALTVVTALGFGFMCFLGKNFFTLGNTTESIIWSVIITVLLAGLAFIAKLLKRTNRNFKTCFILEIFVIIIFTSLMAFFTYTLFPHFFSVSENKSEVRAKIKASITQAETMFTEYEKYVENRKNNYKGSLETAVATKESNSQDYKAYGFEQGAIPDETQLKNKMFSINADLYPTTYSDPVNNNGLKEVATSWLSSARQTMNSWNPISVVKVVNEIEKNSKDWLDQLVRYSKVREKGEPENLQNFPYILNFTDVKSHFTKKGEPTLISYGLAIGAYLLMLLSYFISKRSSKTIIGTTKNKGEYDIDF